jgi:hypothetical protein
LDHLLFSDRDWQMASAEMIRRPEVRECLRIEDHYFDVRYRKLGASELQKARRVFREILRRATTGRSAEGLELIPPLHRI